MEYHIGVLFRQRFENLLVAGRCISADFYAESAIRISSTCMAIGEAAGTAAALCVVKHKSPRDLDANLLRQKLASQGVCLNNLYIILHWWMKSKAWRCEEADICLSFFEVGRFIERWH